MRYKTIILSSALVLAAVAAYAQGSAFVSAQAIHIEPLGKVDIPPNIILNDTVVLQLTIDTQGRVSDAKVWSTSGNENVDAAALEAAKKCLFSPATQDGVPVVYYYQIYYRLATYKKTLYPSAPGTAEKKATAETAAPPPAPHDEKKKDH